jgi:hypothetical protein
VLSAGLSGPAGYLGQVGRCCCRSR